MLMTRLLLTVRQLPSWVLLLLLILARSLPFVLFLRQALALPQTFPRLVLTHLVPLALQSMQPRHQLPLLLVPQPDSTLVTWCSSRILLPVVLPVPSVWLLLLALQPACRLVVTPR